MEQYIYYLIVLIFGYGLWSARSINATRISDYLLHTELLLNKGRYTDGCSTPFKTQIHRYLKWSHLLCAGHDYGNLGYLTEIVKPGIRNNWLCWLAHLSRANPLYWLWGTIAMIVTLPWVVWRRDLGIKEFGLVHFYIMATVVTGMFVLIYTQAF